MDHQARTDRPCRHLQIEFLESGDVKYGYFRHHDHTRLCRYLIEWPADRIEILGGQGLYEDHLRQTVTPSGFLLLEWDKVSTPGSKSGRGIDYIKKGYLQHPPNEAEVWHYREQFNVKPDLSLALHSPWRRINALASRSTAFFQDKDGRAQSFRPRELIEYVFRKPGVLFVDWQMETLSEPKRNW